MRLSVLFSSAQWLSDEILHTSPVTNHATPTGEGIAPFVGFLAVSDRFHFGGYWGLLQLGMCLAGRKIKEQERVDTSPTNTLGYLFAELSGSIRVHAIPLLLAGAAFYRNGNDTTSFPRE
jgi:hypothetical protein